VFPLPQAVADNVRVLPPGMQLQFGMAAETAQCAVMQFHIACGKRLFVGKLFAHVEMIHAAGKDEDNWLP